MTTYAKTSSSFIEKLAKDYPQFRFRPGAQEHWSPKDSAITYSKSGTPRELYYGLLHELAHALLDHSSYRSDFELLKLESQAWDLAAQIGKKYEISIDDGHIQNCLDTYRDFLHRRSKCPTCDMHVMQKDPTTYKCFNCGASWHVSSRRFSRSYRRKIT